MGQPCSFSCFKGGIGNPDGSTGNSTVNWFVLVEIHSDDT
jgi:hypothetical protein